MTSLNPAWRCAAAGLRWRIDGRELGRGARWGWLPWPGRHRVELLDARGDVRLGALQALCGAGHALLEGHGAEEGEAGEIHGLL